MNKFDAVLVVSFGGPESPDDVMPFLRNVVRGKNIPDERLQAVAHHYQLFAGISPINGQNRRLIAALRAELDEHQIDLPIYWGNRNWNPMLEDTVAAMATAGVRRALAFVTSAYSSYSGCRQYLEDIERACATVGPQAPVIEKLRVYYNQPGFLEANVELLRRVVMSLDTASKDEVHVAFSAHSIPISMAKGCRYTEQLVEVAQTVASGVGIRNWKLVFQSRSGPPTQPWLEPDICEHIRSLSQSGVKNLVVAPIGFVSDHMEVVFDLDTEAAQLCTKLGMNMVRAETVGTHPAFVRMIRELVVEGMHGEAGSGSMTVRSDTDLCGASCCPYSVDPLAREVQVKRGNRVR
jgi:ferrochelatase